MSHAAAPEVRPPHGRRFFQVRVRGALTLVACFAVITWSGLRIKDNLEGSESLRRIREGTAAERRAAAAELRSETTAGAIEGAFSALLEALADDDAEVRAMASGSLAALARRSQAQMAASASVRPRVDVAA